MGNGACLQASWLAPLLPLTLLPLSLSLLTDKSPLRPLVATPSPLPAVAMVSARLCLGLAVVALVASALAPSAVTAMGCPPLRRSPLPKSVYPMDYTTAYEQFKPSAKDCCCWYKRPVSKTVSGSGGSVIRVRADGVSAEVRSGNAGGYSQTVALSFGKPGTGGAGMSIRTSGGIDFSRADNGKTLPLAGPTRGRFETYWANLYDRIVLVRLQGPQSCAPDSSQLGAVLLFMDNVAWAHGLSTTRGCPRRFPFAPK